jgi:hypothetical protein
LFAQVHSIGVDQTQTTMLDQAFEIAAMLGLQGDAIQVEPCNHTPIHDDYD